MNIKAIRMSRNMTQEELAAKLSVSRSTVAMWETGANMPESNRLVSIAKVLECSIDELFGEEGKIPLVGRETVI